MPPGHLVVMLPALVLWGLAPGLALATTCAPRSPWGVRLAAAPGLSTGLVGLIGLVEHMAHVRFDAFTVAPALLLLTIVGLLRHRRRATDPRPHWLRGGRAVRAATVAAALGGLAACTMVVVTYRNAELPVWDDAAFHGGLANRIAHDGDVYELQPLPSLQTGFFRPQMGMEATSALLAETSPLQPADALLPLTLLAVLLLPTSVMVLTRMATTSQVAPVVAPLLTIGTLMPGFAVGAGSFPQVLDWTLVVPALWALRGWFRDGDRECLALLAACAIAVLAVHGLEVYTVALFGLPLLAGELRSASPRELLRRAGLALVTVAALGLVFLVLSRHPAVPSGVAAPPASHTTAGSARVPGGTPLGDVLSAAYGLLTNNALGALLLLLGTVYAVARRQSWWALAALAINLLLLIDRATVMVLRPLYARSFPWGEPIRLTELYYFFVPVVMALGIAGAAETLAEESARRLQRVLGPAVVAVALVYTTLLVQADHDRTAGLAQQHDVVTKGSRQVIVALGQALPPHASVLNDGLDDAGKWVDALTQDVQYFPKSAVDGDPDDPIFVALEHACVDPAAADRAVRGFDGVVVGDLLDSGALHPWDSGCLRQLPSLEEVASATDPGGRTAVAFRVRKLPA